ncbi:MAG: pseudouridine synthase, partial [Deltaproteobacteria bacterium]
MRLNKFIAHNSKYSRRSADELISAGKISINGNVVRQMATRVEEGDEVRLDGKLLVEKFMHTFIIYNKPRGELVTHKDDRSRRIIFDSLPKSFRGFISVGRLDFASEGLIILGDDKRLVSLLERSNLERSYNIKIAGSLSLEVI